MVALWDTNLSHADSPEDSIKRANLLLLVKLCISTTASFFKWNKRQIKCWPWAPKRPWTGKQAGTSAQQGKTKKSQSEKISLTSVSSSSGYLPGGAQWFTAHTRGLVWGQGHAWPWYTGAEALRAKTPSNRQQCPLSVSFFSKPITEVGAQEKWLYHPCLSGHSLFLSAKAPDTNRRSSEDHS